MLRVAFILILSCVPLYTAAQPNIVFIFADDLGIGDVGVYGGEVIKTPNIDKLAMDGIRFSQAYVSHPVCSPSRAGLMTGRYQQRHGWEFNPAQRDTGVGMDPEQVTLADMLKASGYRTAMIGKWHLGYGNPYHPLSRGFEQYFGVLAGGSIFIDHRLPGVESVGTWPSKRGEINAVYEGFDVIEVDEYLTDTFTTRAVDFVSQDHEAPYFLYLSHTTPHTPLQATKKYLDRYRHIEDASARIYAAMVASLDDSVGAVVHALEASGQLENTLIVFSSDNGCAGYIKVCSNAPYAGFKRYHNEGGIRVPLIMHWPKNLESSTYPHMVSLLDLMATFGDVAGSKFTTEDSVNLIPYLSGKRQSETPHKYLYWRSGPTQVIRDERWKLISYAKSEYSRDDLDSALRIPPPEGGWPRVAQHGRVTLLFDLETDPGETIDLSGSLPETLSRLQSAYDEWNSTLPSDSILPAIRSTIAEMYGENLQLIF